mgnify:CR=1 FL=1
MRMNSIRPLLITLFSALLTACAGSPPNNLGYSDNAFLPCPSSPNCVSSFAKDDHYIKAILFSGEPTVAHQTLLNYFNEQEHILIKQSNFPYLYAEFKSNLLGFVDDAEFYFQSDKIQVRSASRLGYSDLGVNRERIEQIRRIFNPSK